MPDSTREETVLGPTAAHAPAYDEDENSNAEQDDSAPLADIPLQAPKFQPHRPPPSLPRFTAPAPAPPPDRPLRLKFYESLLSVLSDFPLIKRDQSVKPYSLAATRSTWNSWSLGRRYACEWQRALFIRERCRACIPAGGGDAFFSVRRVFRFCRLVGAVPFLPRGSINLADVDARLVAPRSAEPDAPPLGVSANVMRSDVEFVWQVVGVLHPDAVPVQDWAPDSQWTVAGLSLYAAVKAFAEKILRVGSQTGVPISKLGGAAELAKAIKEHGHELRFLDHTAFGDASSSASTAKDEKTEAEAANLNFPGTDAKGEAPRILHD